MISKKALSRLPKKKAEEEKKRDEDIKKRDEDMVIQELWSYGICYSCSSEDITVFHDFENIESKCNECGAATKFYDMLVEEKNTR